VPYRDLSHFLETLDDKGLLTRVRAPVSHDLEIAEINDRVVKAAGPALLFENVTGHAIPVAINLFGTRERMALALEVESLEKLPGRLTTFLDFALNPPANFWEKLKSIPKLAGMAAFLPKNVADGPCKEMIYKGDDVDILRYPILRCWPQDAGRFITYPLVFTRDPETGRRNCGCYRMQLFDKSTTAMHFHPHKDGARHFRRSRERLPVAVAIGSDPSVCFAGTLPLPPDMDEILFAGLVRQEAVRMVKCETVDLEVPANAEIVLEGYLDPEERRVEGPFGDHTGYYSLADEFPVFHVTCVTQRRKPVYHTIVVGPPIQEDDWIGYAIERLFLPLLKLHLPEVVDYHMPFEGVFHNMLIVAIRKQYPGHARKVMHALWGMGQAMFSKCIVIVDEDVDVQKVGEVAWKALNHIDPERDIEFVHGPIDILDHASRLPGYGSKMGVDATRKWKGEGFERPWPDEIRMSPEIRELVSRKWKEYGL
jgi:4-hydroxy-3-polyprenylbenzoate decarboxylase